MVALLSLRPKSPRFHLILTPKPIQQQQQQQQTILRHLFCLWISNFCFFYASCLSLSFPLPICPLLTMVNGCFCKTLRFSLTLFDRSMIGFGLSPCSFHVPCIATEFGVLFSFLFLSFPFLGMVFYCSLVCWSGGLSASARADTWPELSWPVRFYFLLEKSHCP